MPVLLILLLFTITIATKTQNITTINVFWRDDHDCANGWSDCVMYTSENGSNITYHGKYNENTELSRTFQCDKDSNISVSFSIKSCLMSLDNEINNFSLNVNENTKLSLNNDGNDQNIIQIYSDNDLSCRSDEFQSIVFQNRSILANVHSYSPFSIQFIFNTLHGNDNDSDNEWWVIYDISLFCLPTSMSSSTIIPLNNDDSLEDTLTLSSRTKLLIIMGISISVLCCVCICIVCITIIWIYHHGKDMNHKFMSSQISNIYSPNNFRRKSTKTKSKTITTTERLKSNKQHRSINSHSLIINGSKLEKILIATPNNCENNRMQIVVDSDDDDNDDNDNNNGQDDNPGETIIYKNKNNFNDDSLLNLSNKRVHHIHAKLYKLSASFPDIDKGHSPITVTTTASDETKTTSTTAATVTTSDITCTPGCQLPKKQFTPGQWM